jgi:hypothetical protein
MIAGQGCGKRAAAAGDGSSNLGSQCPARCNISVPPKNVFPDADANAPLLGPWTRGQLAILDGYIYFVINGFDEAGHRAIDRNGIRRIRTDGSSPELVVATPNPVAFALGPDVVVYTDDGPEVGPGVFAAPLDGGAARQLATTSPPSGSRIATDGAEAFFSDTRGVQAIPLAGGAVRTVSATSGDLALVGDRVVVADADGGSILSFSIDGNADPVTLASGRAVPASPIACGSNVCWVENAPGICDSLLDIPATQAVVLGAGGVTTVAASSCGKDEWARPSVVSDETELFLVTGDVFAAPIGGGNLTPVMGGDIVFSGAVDSCCFYFSDVVGIEGAPKPDMLDAGD